MTSFAPDGGGRGSGRRASRRSGPPGSSPSSSTAGPRGPASRLAICASSAFALPLAPGNVADAAGPGPSRRRRRPRRRLRISALRARRAASSSRHVRRAARISPFLRYPRRKRLAQLRSLRFGQGQGLAGELRARRELFAQAIHGVADADLGHGQQHHQDAGDVRHRVEQRVEVLGVPATARAAATHVVRPALVMTRPSPRSRASLRRWIAIFPWRTPLRVASWDARS